MWHDLSRCPSTQGTVEVVQAFPNVCAGFIFTFQVPLYIFHSTCHPPVCPRIPVHTKQCPEMSSDRRTGFYLFCLWHWVKKTVAIGRFNQTFLLKFPPSALRKTTTVFTGKTQRGPSSQPSPLNPFSEEGSLIAPAVPPPCTPTQGVLYHFRS